jgi:ribosome recycling factor
MNEMAALILEEATDKMGRAVTHLADELKGIRTGRASPALLDAVRVDYYGSPTPLIQLAQVSAPEPRMLMIKPFDASTCGAIEKAILKANIGLTPNNDGKVVRLVLPPLSEENRKKLSANVKDLAEKARVALRNVRRDLNKQVEDSEGKDFTEDEAKQLQTKIQDKLKEFEGKVDEVLKKKIAEIMQV